jgi:hypothetical protein
MPSDYVIAHIQDLNGSRSTWCFNHRASDKAPQFLMLLAAQSVRLSRCKQQRPCSVRPIEAALANTIDGTLVRGTDGKDSTLTLHHDVAQVISRCRNEVHVVIAALDPPPDQLCPAACLAESAAGENEPGCPIAARMTCAIAWRKLLRACPAWPVISKSLKFDIGKSRKPLLNPRLLADLFDYR